MNSFFRLSFCCLLGGVGLFFSCDDDEQPFPPLRFELCELATDDAGVARELRFDDGRSLPPLVSLSALRRDTIYRVFAGYLPTPDEKADLRHLSLVVSPLARAFESHNIRTAPVKLIAIWASKRYLNMRIGVPRNNGRKHYFGFVDNGIDRIDSGRRRLNLCLYHDRSGEDIHYYEELHLSCPLYPYDGRLTRGVDSVAIEINTPKGIYRHAVLF